MSSLLWPRATGRQLPRAACPPAPRASGQALTEFALIVPVMLLLLLMAVDFGRLFFSYIQISNAAREGAAYAAQQPTDDVTIADYVDAETNSQRQAGEGALAVTVTCADTAGSTIACSDAPGGAGRGNTVTVAVNEGFSFLTPLVNNFFGGALPIRATATAAVLGTVPGAGGTPPGACSLPTADFTVIVTSGLSVFADPSASRPNSGVCNISGYNWKWGDGNIDVGQATGDPHTYTAPGTYTIELEVTNQAGPATTTRQVTVPAGPPPPTCAKPTANFNWTKSGKTYTYTDASTVADPVNCPITDWLWTFTDAGGLQSNAQNPAPVTYTNNSSHPVTLQVTNAGGTSTITRNS
jgi:PKD repeat protein